MRTKTIELYSYSELSPEAQSKARDWMRESMAGDNFFAEHITSEFVELLAAVGFDGVREKDISWSGFWSQGDGAAFHGNWRAELCTPSKWLDERPVSYTNRETGAVEKCKHNARWHVAVQPFIDMARTYPTADAGCTVGRGFFMALSETYNFEPVPADDLDDASWRTIDRRNDRVAEVFIEAARDLAAEFYHNLESEWEYQHSDSVIAENIQANEYEFTSDGSIA